MYRPSEDINIVAYTIKKPNIEIPPHFETLPPRTFAHGVPKRLSRIVEFPAALGAALIPFIVGQMIRY